MNRFLSVLCVLAVALPAAATTATTTSVSMDMPTLTYGTGATETFTVTVTGAAGDGAPNGTATVSGSGGLGTLATITFAAAGMCTAGAHNYIRICTGTGTIPANTAPGSYTITAAYSGSAIYSASSGTATLTINQAATTTSLALSNNMLTFGVGPTTETFTVTVTGDAGDGAPTGTATVSGSGGLGTLATITFAAGGTCTAGAHNYIRTCTGTGTVPRATAAGSYTITATYSGNTNYAGSAGTAGLTISPGTSTATVTNVASTYGGTATLTAKNKGVTGTAVAPTGVPTFMVNGVTAAGAATCTSANVTTTCTLSYVLPPALAGTATYPITVSFAADTNYTAATGSGTLTVNVAAATAAIANATGHYAGAADLSETNTGVGAAYAAPTGALTVTVGAYTQTRQKNCATAADVTSCAAKYSIRVSQTQGTYTMTAKFAADSNYAASMATGTLSVTLDRSKTTVTATPANPKPSGTVVLAATVNNISHGATTPTGTVTFTTGSTTLGNCTLAGATCSITVPASSFTANASNTVTAAYGGLSLEIAGSSGTVVVTPNADIVFSSVTHNFGTVPLGDVATYGVSVTNNDAAAFPFSLTLTGPSTFTSATNCGTSLASSGTCEIVFTYTPTAAASETATWSLAPNGLTFSPGNGGTLTATGVASAGVTLSTSAHDFDMQAVGTISDVYGVVLTNGTASAINVTIATGTDTTDFLVFADNCPATLQAYQSCNLQYEFAPQSVGFLSDFIGITATSGGNPVTITSLGSTVTGINLDGDGD